MPANTHDKIKLVTNFSIILSLCPECDQINNILRLLLQTNVYLNDFIKSFSKLIFSIISDNKFFEI